MPFVKSKPPLPTRSLRSLRAAARSTSSALCLHHSHPFVQLPMCSKCDALPKGNLWDMLVGFRNPFPLFFSSKDELVRVKYWVGRDNPARPSSGLKFEFWISDGFEWFFIINILYPQSASLSAAHVRKMWLTAQKRFVRHVSLRNVFPPFLLGFPSIHTLPEAGSRERQYAPPVLHYGCIMPIPSLQLQKKTRLMQRSGGFGHAVVVSDISYNTQGHQFHPDSPKKIEWLLELSFGNAGPSSQANLYKSMPRSAFKSTSLWMNHGVEKVEPPESHWLLADRV